VVVLLPLAVLAQAASAPAAEPSRLPAIEPVLFLDHGALTPHRHAPRPRFVPGESGTLRASVQGPSYTATLTETRAGPLRAFTIEIRYTKPVSVRHEWIEVDLPAESATALGRDSVLHDLRPVLYLDTYAPKYVATQSHGRTLVLVGGDDLEGMALHRGPHSVKVTLELDDTANHPFRHEARCRTSWRQKAPSVEHSARYRAAGETQSYHFYVGEVAPGPAPLIKQRFPEGFRAALALTDHADQSSLETLRALLYGTSSEKAPRFGCGGFLGHHLSLTKSLFFDSAGLAPPQLDDPRVQQLALEMVRLGIEVIPHSATPRRDDRVTTERALRFFQTLAAHTWIDHQVETNCEAFTDRGWKPGDPYYIADLLVRYGYRYIWAGRDPGTPAGELNMLAPDHPELRTPWLYAHGPDAAGAPRLLLWRSAWMYLDAPRFYAAYAPQALDRLELERGLHIAHTYLESMHTHGPYQRKHVLARAPDGSIETTPQFEELLGEFQKRAQRGSLWVAPVGAIADHVVAMSQVELSYLDDGAAVVRNRGPHPVRGATFTAHGPVLVDGVPPAAARVEVDGYTFWLDLAPDRSYRVETDGGFIKPPPPASPLPLAR